jgi:hypothetical protein
VISTIVSLAFTAFLSVVAKLATQSFMEAILTRIIIYAGEKLAPMTTNTLDDELVVEIKKRLTKEGAIP